MRKPPHRKLGRRRKRGSECQIQGTRTLCRIDRDQIALLTRGRDTTARYVGLLPSLRQLELTNALIDGEVTCLGVNGRTDRRALRAALAGERSENLLYYVFDLLFLDGR